MGLKNDILKQSCVLNQILKTFSRKGLSKATEKQSRKTMQKVKDNGKEMTPGFIKVRSK